MRWADFKGLRRQLFVNVAQKRFRIHLRRKVHHSVCSLFLKHVMWLARILQKRQVSFSLLFNIASVCVCAAHLERKVSCHTRCTDFGKARD